MRNSLFFKLSLIAVSIGYQHAEAATTQLIASVENSKFLDGVNLTNDSPALSLNVDWTFDQGSFLGANCYASSADSILGLDEGCDIYAGYFKPLNENNAVSLQITRHEYSSGIIPDWDFTDVAISWLPSKTSSISLIYSNRWLQRPFDTFALKAETQIPVSENWALNLSGTVMAIESGAPVNKLLYGKASLSYVKKRWTTELGLVYTDENQHTILPFDIDEPDFLLSLSYRLY